MWNQLANIPSILVGQGIFSFLNVESIVRLETAVASSERVLALRSFLSYFTKEDIIVNIPNETSKLKWLQTHGIQITKVTVNLNKIYAIFDANMINEIALVGNGYIDSSILTNLPDSCYEKVVSIFFYDDLNEELMEELFSCLHNLREVTVNCRHDVWDGWLLSALRRLHRETNNNVLIEKVHINTSEASVVEIAKYCPKLQSLSGNRNIGEDSLLALSTHCPLLKRIVMIWHMPRISTEQTAALCVPALSCIQSIQTPYSIGLQTDVTHYVRTVPYLTELKEVVVVSRIDHVLLPLLSQHCLKLNIISVLEKSSATTTQLLQLAQNCRNIHTILLVNDRINTDELIIGLAKRCPNLRSLYVEATANITDNSILALSEHCPQLRELMLQYTNLSLTTEDAILQLIRRCKYLHILKLPLSCLSEETVLTLPVAASRDHSIWTLTFDT